MIIVDIIKNHPPSYQVFCNFWIIFYKMT